MERAVKSVNTEMLRYNDQSGLDRWSWTLLRLETGKYCSLCHSAQIVPDVELKSKKQERKCSHVPEKRKEDQTMYLSCIQPVPLQTRSFNPELFQFRVWTTFLYAEGGEAVDWMQSEPSQLLQLEQRVTRLPLMPSLTFLLQLSVLFGRQTVGQLTGWLWL